MRMMLAAAATSLAATMVTSTVAYTQTKSAQATNNPSATKASLSDSYNRCVSLARSRGYTESDLDGNRAAARNFVVRCMQGRQH
jgi:cytochrome oxidase Cu insertion factor (SCO1/SenC/PrrC family)